MDGDEDGNGEEEEDWVDDLPQRSRGRRGRAPRRRKAAAVGDEEDNKPSNLLKLLRPPIAARPLFLAAPGVANAQVGMWLGDQL